MRCKIKAKLRHIVVQHLIYYEKTEILLWIFLALITKSLKKRVYYQRPSEADES